MVNLCEIKLLFIAWRLHCFHQVLLLVQMAQDNVERSILSELYNVIFLQKLLFLTHLVFLTITIIFVVVIEVRD